MATFYIESGTGRTVSDTSQFVAGHSYTQSGTGAVLQGPAGTTNTAPAPTATSSGGSSGGPSTVFSGFPALPGETSAQYYARYDARNSTTTAAPAPTTSTGALYIDSTGSYTDATGTKLTAAQAQTYLDGGAQVTYRATSPTATAPTQTQAPAPATAPAATTPTPTAGVFYIESGTGRQVSDPSQFVAGHSYVASNTGAVVNGPAAPTTATPAAAQAPASTAQPAAAVPQITSNLGPGSTGPEVATLQSWLISQGYSIPSLQNGAAKPGTYGPETMAAVTQWQRDQEAKGTLHVPDPSQYGYFGPLSRQAMTGSTAAAPAGSATTSTAPATGTPATGLGSEVDQEIQALRAAYGLGAADPKKSVVQQAIDDYQAIYKSLGISDIKQSYKDAADEFASIQNELNDKVTNIRDNPWLSQGVADARVESLKKSYETKLDIATNKMQLYDALTKEGIAQANDIVSRVHQIQSDNASVVNQAIDIVQKKEDALAKLNSTKLDTQVIEVGGRKKLINAQTGAVISDLGAATTGSGAGGTHSGTLVYSAADHAADSQALNASRGSDSYVDPSLYLQYYNGWIAHGGTLEGFIATYPPKNYVNPANSWLPKFLMPTTSGLDAEINSLF